MAENLNYDQDSFGNDWCYGNDSSNCDIYARLYDWSAVMQGEASSNDNPSGVQGVCPDGWHVPSDNEWQELEIYLGMSLSEAIDHGGRGTNEGSKLAGNANLWSDGALENNSLFDASGFTALPGGDCDHNRAFECMGRYGNWYTSTEHASWTGCAWHRSLYYDTTRVFRHILGKEIGFSVRCVRDD